MAMAELPSNNPVIRVPAKKDAPSAKTKIFMILVLVILVASVGGVLLNRQDNRIVAPPASDFSAKGWMSLVPADVTGFRFLNLTEIANYPGVFGSTSLLNITEVGVELSITDASFGLDMATRNGSLINVIGLTDASAQNVSAALQAGNLTTSAYDGVMMYRLSSAPVAGGGGAWICVYNSVLILCEGEDIALEGIKSVIDAAESPFFSSDALKVGYLLSVNGREVLAFTYYEAGGDPYNVDWEMRGVSNSSGLAVRDVLYFPSSSDLESNKKEIMQSLYARAGAVYLSENFMIGAFLYPYSEIRAVLMGL